MFPNRKDAALQLAIALKGYSGKDLIVLGISGGGVETAFYVANELALKLLLIIVLRLKKEDQRQSTIGAMSENGITFYNKNIKRISQETIDNTEDATKREIVRRVNSLRNGYPFPDITGKTVILVDDMIITGATMIAAIKMCKEKGAEKIIVASPFCNQAIESQLKFESDELVVVKMSRKPLKEDQVYYSLYEPSDKEIMYFIKLSKKKATTLLPVHQFQIPHAL